MTRNRVIIILLFLLSSFPALADKQEVRDLDITMILSHKGSVLFDERWDLNTGDNITEWYLVRQNLGDIIIPSFTVLDETGKRFEDDGEWNVNRTLEEKAGKSGIVHKDDGVELCWGIAPRGDHVFYAIYSMVKAMKSLNDYDMLHLQVVSPGMSSPPQHVKVTVKSKDIALDTLNTRAWGFGFEGTTTFTDSCVVFESVKPFRQNNSVIILLRFNKGIFEPLSVQERDFQDALDVALEGASFADDPKEDDDTASAIAGFFTLLVMYFLIFRPIARAFRNPLKVTRKDRRKALGMRPKAVGWYRDIPLEGDLIAANSVLNKLLSDRKGNHLALAVILRLVHEGFIAPTSDLNGKVELRFTGKDTTGMPTYMKRFYDMLKESSGEDNTLQDKEFSKWSKKNDGKVYNWLKTCLSDGASRMRANGFYTSGNDITKTGREMAREVWGLKKFLEDFTLVSERETIEASLWKEYLVFAALFGIADKVADQLKDIDPKLFKETFSYNYGTFSSIMSTSGIISDMVRSAAISGRPAPVYSGGGGGSSYSGSGSRGGYGGHTSSGGGGGYSGGGRGGGGR